MSASSSHGVSWRKCAPFASIANSALLNGSLRIRVNVMVRPSGVQCAL
jgi:hypothetical protein